MLDSVASYHHCMQFQGKLMNQTWENGKKSSFKTDFSSFVPYLGPQIFFHRFYFYYMLDIVASYHCMQFQGKLMNQTWKIAKNLVLGPILACLTQIWATKFFFQKSGSISH